MVILTPWWQIHYITGTYWLQIPKQWGITVWGASQSHQLLFDLNLIGNCCCLRGSSVKERGMHVKTVLHNLFLLNTNEWVSNFQSFILPLKVLTSLRLLKRHLETNLYSYQSLIKKKKRIDKHVVQSFGQQILLAFFLNTSCIFRNFICLITWSKSCADSCTGTKWFTEAKPRSLA